MIVRIATEGQYRVPSAILDKLNGMDNELVRVVSEGDQAAFTNALEGILTLVRQNGSQIEAEELISSDIILPAPDTTIEEARSLFSGEGVIPG